MKCPIIMRFTTDKAFFFEISVFWFEWKAWINNNILGIWSIWINIKFVWKSVVSLKFQSWNARSFNSKCCFFFSFGSHGNTKVSFEEIKYDFYQYKIALNNASRSEWLHTTFGMEQLLKKASIKPSAFQKRSVSLRSKASTSKVKSAYLSQNESRRSVRPNSGLVLLFDCPLSQWTHVQNEYCEP